MAADSDPKDSHPDRAVALAVFGGALSAVLWGAFGVFVDYRANRPVHVDLAIAQVCVAYPAAGATFGMLAVIGFRLITGRR
jgi:hypothetical protein